MQASARTAAGRSLRSWSAVVTPTVEREERSAAEQRLGGALLSPSPLTDRPAGVEGDPEAFRPDLGITGSTKHYDEQKYLRCARSRIRSA